MFSSSSVPYRVHDDGTGGRTGGEGDAIHTDNDDNV